MNENSGKKQEQTSKNQLFRKGGVGGPGRGKISADATERDLITRIEQVVRSGMKKGELADRLKAAGLGIKLKGMKEHKVEPITTPFVLKMIGLLADLAMRCSQKDDILNAISVIDRMAKVCPSCTAICKGPDEFAVISDD